MEKHSIAAFLQSVGATLPSKGHGWRKMRCPFHSDSHASSAINYEQNRFKCFACDYSGDVYDLIMKYKGGDYREAVKYAETISPESNTTVSGKHRTGRRVSFNPESVGRRGKTISSRGSE